VYNGNLYFNAFQDNFRKKMSNEETESTSLLDFSKVDNEDDQDNNSKQEVKEKKEK